jgi:hypothetical protein
MLHVELCCAFEARPNVQRPSGRSAEEASGGSPHASHAGGAPGLTSTAERSSHVAHTLRPHEVHGGAAVAILAIVVTSDYRDAERVGLPVEGGEDAWLPVEGGADTGLPCTLHAG